MIKPRDFFSCIKRVVIVAILLSNIQYLAHAGVTPGVKFLFLNRERRSVSLPITNPEDSPLEVTIAVKFGYVVSNDSGQPTVLYDSSGTAVQSAAEWVKVYPHRFILGPLESQIVRLTALPPPNLPDGEYWARVQITSQNTKARPTLVAKKASGMIFVQQVVLPFHYRLGNATTGLDIQNFTVESSEKAINVNMDMMKKGNASYWGTAAFRVFNAERRLLIDTTCNVVVYTKFRTSYALDRKGIPPGDYTLEMEFRNDNRHDIRRTDITQAPPIRLSKLLTIK
jgi:hypothetical protein